MHSDPVLIAYGVRTTKSGRNTWTRIGEAYPHSEGAGLTDKLNVIPLDGKIVLLERDEMDDQRLARRARRLGERL